MAVNGFRARIRRTNDNAILWDSAIPGSHFGVTIADKPGAGTWSYVLELIGVNSGSTNTLYTDRNTISVQGLNK